MQKTKTQALWFILIFILATVIRLLPLGYSAFRADTMDFYRYAINETSPTHILKNQPWQNQIPVTEAYVLWFIQTTGVPINAWTVRFPIALLGLFAVFFIYKLCSLEFGQEAGLIAAFLTAINPFAVSISMEAYYYSGVICFAAMFYWTTTRLVSKLTKQTAKNRDWILWAISASLICSTHMITWAIFGAVWLFITLLAWKTSDRQNFFKTFISLFTCAFIVVLAVLPWLITAVRTYLFGDLQPLGIGSAPWSNFLKILSETLPIFTFGKTATGILILLLTILAGLLTARRNGKPKSENNPPESNRNHVHFFLMAACAIAGNIALCAFMGKGHAKYVYFAGLFPLAICSIVYLFKKITATISLKLKVDHRYGLPVAALLCSLFWAIPLHAVLTLEGRPTAYKTIANYINTNTRPGTLVLVDRWFEPWNELALYPLEDGRQWTFTVPNEPAQTAVQMEWHKSVEKFFEKYPEALYLPLVNSYRNPSMGPWYIGQWNWPDRHFSNHVQLPHTAAIRLRNWGLATREGFYDANDGRLNVNIYFNTREQLIERAHAKGKPCLRLYGPRWRYIKLWQPQQNSDPRVFQTFWLHAGFYMETGETIKDINLVQRMPQEQVGLFINKGRFADYLIPDESTYLDLYNLTGAPGNFVLKVTAFAPGGSAACRIGEQTERFSSTLSQKEIALTLDPGHNVLQLVQNQKAPPLLIINISLLYTESATSTAQ